MIEIFWDQELSTPIIVQDKETISLSKNTLTYMAKDLRPVFLEEKYLLYQIIPEVNLDLYNYYTSNLEINFIKSFRKGDR
jgi:hypothetical protein